MLRRVLFRARQLCVGAPDLAPPARLADLAGVPFLGFSAEMTLSAFGPMGAESVTLRARGSRFCQLS